ncbi:hypothetical protein [Desulfovibrio sp. ZJ200]|uniref:hypothetical protein n=1 Tax=Desulfovibrio sp. ZJ200 TaxID=2709792 RepID=UPI0013EB1C7D|nr:hypothetical protein [Desulfovibrio sp. ZJ200]
MRALKSSFVRRNVVERCAHENSETLWRAKPCQSVQLEHFLFENALLTRKRQPPQRGVHSGENRVFRLNATFDFHKKSKVICSS